MYIFICMVLSFNIRCNFVFQVIYPNVHKAFPKISDSHALPERANLKKLISIQVGPSCFAHSTESSVWFLRALIELLPEEQAALQNHQNFDVLRRGSQCFLVFWGVLWIFVTDTLMIE